MSLFQKYRPKNFDALYGQEFVREVLQNALKLDRTVGAYLFNGSRGTGKTSVARIMAKGMNCLSLREDGNPCDACENCIAFNEWRLLDVVEIDAASNTGVDNIREMIERAQFQPTQARYKVYIIDEVHMLSKGAFNALLKTLEEPPAHVKFILATTEIHKIPDTIISRTQRYDFKRIKPVDIIARLRYIAEQEGIQVEESALQLLATLAKGWLRDAITLFEQYATGGVLKRKYIEENLEIIAEEFLSSFVQAIKLQDREKVLSSLQSLREKGVDVRLFLEQTISFLRDQMVACVGSSEFGAYLRIFDTFESAYGKAKYTSDPFILLEISTLRLLESVSEVGVVAPTKTTTPAPKVITSEVKITIPSPKAPEPKTEAAPEKSSTQKDSKDTAYTPEKPFQYNTLIEHIRTVPKRSFVGLSLKASSYEFSDGMLIISPENEFNFGKLDTTDVKSFLVECMDSLFGSGHSVEIRKPGGVSKKSAKSLADEAGDIF